MQFFLRDTNDQRRINRGFLMPVISTEGPVVPARSGEVWSRTKSNFYPLPDASTSLSMTKKGNGMVSFPAQESTEENNNEFVSKLRALRGEQTRSG